MTITTAGEALNTRASSVKIGQWGKKTWTPGNMYRVFYPIHKLPNGKWDLIVATGWGHNIDGKALSGLERYWVPTTSEVKDGIPIVPDFMYEFSKVAAILHEAKKVEVITRINKGAGSQTTKQATIKKETEKLDKDGPVVGRLHFAIITECLVVEISSDANMNINVEHIKPTQQSLSPTKIAAIQSALNDIQAQIPEDALYAEVVYKFPSGEREEAGKSLPGVVTPEYRLENLHPEVYKNAVVPVLGTLQRSSDVIAKRSYNFVPYDVNVAVSALSTYMALHSSHFSALTEEEALVDRLKKSAVILTELGVKSNEDLHLDFEELADQQLKATAKNIKSEFEAAITNAVTATDDAEEEADRLGANIEIQGDEPEEKAV